MWMWSWSFSDLLLQLSHYLNYEFERISNKFGRYEIHKENKMVFLFQTWDFNYGFQWVFEVNAIFMERLFCTDMMI